MPVCEPFHVENMVLPSCSPVWRMNIAYMLGLSCSSGNGTNIKMLMPCSTNWGPWDKIWKFLRRSLWAPINIIIITTTATITFACQCAKAFLDQSTKLSYNDDDLPSCQNQLNVAAAGWRTARNLWCDVLGRSFQKFCICTSATTSPCG